MGIAKPFWTVLHGELPCGGPVFSDSFAAFLRCIGFWFHAAFCCSNPTWYTSSGACRSRADWSLLILWKVIASLIVRLAWKPLVISSR